MEDVIGTFWRATVRELLESYHKNIKISFS